LLFLHYALSTSRRLRDGCAIKTHFILSHCKLEPVAQPPFNAFTHIEMHAHMRLLWLHK